MYNAYACKYSANLHFCLERKNIVIYLLNKVYSKYNITYGLIQKCLTVYKHIKTVTVAK
jgi:hypothetical protein